MPEWDPTQPEDAGASEVADGASEVAELKELIAKKIAVLDSIINRLEEHSSHWSRWRRWFSRQR
jgi:hypothetical protein